MSELASWNWYTIRTPSDAPTTGEAPAAAAPPSPVAPAPPPIPSAPPPAAPAAPAPPPIPASSEAPTAAEPPPTTSVSHWPKAPAEPAPRAVRMPPPAAAPRPIPAAPSIGPGFAAPAQVPAGIDGSTHVTPDAGIQSYPQAYPPYPAKLGPYLSGRRAVQVVEVRGTWAHVVADGEEQGWVEGSQLVPPVRGGVRYATATTRAPAGVVVVQGQRSISNGQIVGAVGALGMIIGALVTWTQIVSINAFKFPVQFLFDNKTQSHNPRLGWFIVLLGILGIAASLVRGAEFWRTIIGVFGVLIAILFLIQIASGLSSTFGPFGTHAGFADVVGGGPWITAIAALVLGISPVFD